MSHSKHNTALSIILAIIFAILLPTSALAKVSAEEMSEMSLEDLLNVEVTIASKSSERLSDAPGIISVVTRDELDRFGGLSLKEVLERVPGLTSSREIITEGTTFFARGAQVRNNSGHILLLVNGRPTREVLGGGMSSSFFQSFPVDIIERIEVIKGPGSVLYGSGAFSAVINVITQEAEDSSLAVRGLGGITGGGAASGEGTLKAGDWKFVAAGRFLQREDWNLTFTGIDITGTPGTQEVTIEDEGYGTYFELGYKNLTYMGSYTQWKNQTMVVPLSAPAKWDRLFQDLGYRLEAMDNWNMDFNFSHTRATMSTDDFPYIERTSNFMTVEWTNFIDLMEKINVIIGGAYEHSIGEELFSGMPGPAVAVTDTDRWGYRLYTQVDYMPLHNLKLLAGVQLNKVEGIDVNVAPRGGIIWYPHPRINVKALYSQAFRAPSLNEVALRHPSLHGSSDLKHEQVRTVELGLGYLGAQFQGSGNFFYIEEKDIIVRDFSVAPGIHRNLGEITLLGFELEGKYYVTPEVFLTGSLTYKTSEDQDGNEDVTPVSKILGKAGVSYMSDNGISMSLFGVYQGDPDDRWKGLGNPDPESHLIASLHSKLNLTKLLNLGLDQDISLLIQVDNLFDEEVYLPRWGDFQPPGTDTNPVNQGISAYVGLEVEF
jgi:outer membrane receptor protein involved in Fe transport